MTTVRHDNDHDQNYSIDNNDAFQHGHHSDRRGEWLGSTRVLQSEHLNFNGICVDKIRTPTEPDPSAPPGLRDLVFFYSNKSSLLNESHNLASVIFSRVVNRIQYDFSVPRLFVGVIDAGKPFDFTPPSLGIETF